MNSSVLDIVSNFHYQDENNDNDDFPEIPQLRRTSTVECKMCNRLIGMFTPTYPKIMCPMCSNELFEKVRRLQEKLNIMKIQYNRKKELLEDIINFGMNPDRIEQLASE